MSSEKYEVGVVTAHPVIFAWRMVKTIFRTWRYARKYGYPVNKWFGVYVSGSEIVAAHAGCLPAAETRAGVIAQALNNRETKP